MCSKERRPPSPSPFFCVHTKVMASTPELQTVKNCTPLLELVLKNCDRSLVHFLCQEGFIGDAVHDDVLNLSILTQQDKAGMLVEGIRDAVSLDAWKYHVLLGYFKKKNGAFYEPIVHVLTEEFSKLGGIPKANDSDRKTMDSDISGQPTDKKAVDCSGSDGPADTKALNSNVDIPTDAPTKPANIIIKGADIVQETTVVVTDEQQQFEWKGYGLRLYVPPQSLPSGTKWVTITIKASLSGQYQFPSDTELVSPVFWLQCSPRCRFKIPLTLEIGHCAPLKNSGHLLMCRALCSQTNLPYTFEVIQGGSFSTQSSYGVISLERFSGLAAVQGRSDERRYWSSVFYMGPVRKRKVHFAVTWDNDAHITTLKEEYMSKNALNGPEQSLLFKQECITLDVPKNGYIQDDWKVRPTVPPKILKKEVDNYHLESKSKAVPHCEMIARWMKQDQDIKALEYLVNIEGTTNENFFTIIIDPSDVQQESIPSTQKKAESAAIVRSGDVNILMSHLYKHAAKWKEIGCSLNFQPGELDIISYNTGATPQQLLTKLLSQWTQWPTKEHPDDPTMERLCDALRSGLVGLGAVANDIYELKNFLPSSQT